MESLGGGNSLGLVFNNVDTYIEKNNENEYLILLLQTRKKKH